MDTPSNVRRSEDIALDLLKFIASTTNVVRGGGSTPGFSAPSTAKADDHIQQLFELYARCRTAVESPADL
jgi:hypothetical protein